MRDPLKKFFFHLPSYQPRVTGSLSIDYAALDGGVNDYLDATATAATAAGLATTVVADSSTQLLSLSDGSQIEIQAMQQSSEAWTPDPTVRPAMGAEGGSALSSSSSSSPSATQLMMTPTDGTDSGSSPLATASTTAASSSSASAVMIVPEFKMESFDCSEISGTVKISYDGEEARREKDVEISEELKKDFEKIDNILLEFMQSDEKVNDLREVAGE